MSHWSRERKLRTGIHVSLVVIFQYNHIVIPERSANSMPHTNIHPAIACNHNKSNIFASWYFTPPLSFFKCIYYTSEGRGTTLEQIMDIGDIMRCIRISGCNNHTASCLEKHNNMPLDPLKKRIKTREYATTRTC